MVLARGHLVTEEFFERKRVLALRRLEQIDPRARPQRAPQLHFVESADVVRQLACATYSACLDVAFTSRWEGFSCESCPAYRALTRGEHLSDVEAMANLLHALFPYDPGRRYVSNREEGGACPEG